MEARELKPFGPKQTALYEAVHQSKLILRIIQCGLYERILSQIVTRIARIESCDRRGGPKVLGFCVAATA